MSTQPTSDEQQEANRLDAVYKAWLAGASAPPEEKIDPALAQTAQHVAHGLYAPTPTPEFAVELRRRLDAAATTAKQSAPQRPAQRFAFGGRVLRVAAVLALAALLGVYLLSLQSAPVNAQEIMRRAQAMLASPAAAGIQSYFLAEHNTSWILGRGETANTDDLPSEWRSEARRWFQSPNLWRMEIQGRPYTADGEPLDHESWNSTIVSDGSSQYDYDAVSNRVSINVASSDASGTIVSADTVGANSLAQLFAGMETCYRPQVTGSAEVAEQPVYVVDLGPTLCPSASAPEANGREIIWVDKNTFFVLKRELYSTEGDRLLMRNEATEVQYNPALDPALFTFTPPAGARVLDYRPQALPAASTVEGAETDGAQAALLAALQPLAQEVDYPLFAPSNIPAGLAPRQPKIMPLDDTLDQVLIELVPAEVVAEDVYAGQAGVIITQQAADYDTVVNFTQGATPVLLPDVTPTTAGEDEAETVQVWARRGFTNVDGTGSDSGVIVLRDGVLITLSSFAFGPEELLTLAAGLQPASGSHAPLPNPQLPPQPPPVSVLPTATPMPTPAFAVLRPTWLPEEMELREQVEGDTVSMGFTAVGSDSPAALVLVQMPNAGEEVAITDPQASTEQIGPYTVTVIRRGAEGCVTYIWKANGLRLTLTNVYDPPGELKYSCEQMRQIVAGIR